MTDYPKPATPLPWLQGTTADVGYSATGPYLIWTVKGTGCGLVATTAPWCQPYDAQQVDAAYIVHAANAFPHLVAALEALQLQALQSDVNDPANEWGHEALEMTRGALAIAHGKLKP